MHTTDGRRLLDPMAGPNKAGLGSGRPLCCPSQCLPKDDFSYRVATRPDSGATVRRSLYAPALAAGHAPRCFRCVRFELRLPTFGSGEIRARVP